MLKQYEVLKIKTMMPKQLEAILNDKVQPYQRIAHVDRDGYIWTVILEARD